MRIISFLTAFLLSFSLQAQFIYNPLPFQAKDFSQINKLKYTKCLVYRMDDGQKNLVMEIEYGNMGLPATQYEKGINDDGDSANIGATVYTYNSKGQLTKTLNEDYEWGETLSTYTYDASGRLKEKKVFTIDPPTYTYRYDAKGNLVERITMQRFPETDDVGEPTGKSFDRLTGRSTFTCNAKGQLTEELAYNDEKQLMYKWTWAYDDKGRLTQVKQFDDEGTVRLEIRCEYNSEGLLSKTIEKNDEGEAVFVYEYNREKQSWMD